MTGRGVDQALPHPGDPRIHESYLESAVDYVRLAERANGPFPHPVDFAYIWGDALDELARVQADARIINLETSITQSDDYWDKGINYRMHPANVGCITAAGIDCCVLANNHVLDYGHAGLGETLDTLAAAGVRTAGAGRDLAQAQAPAVIDRGVEGRVVVFGFGTGSSGIPPSWGATAHRPGVRLLEDLSDDTLADIEANVRTVKRPADVVVASIHWGDNWGFSVPRDHVRFAHGLIRAGVDVVHGHSSHHVRPMELFEGKLILYGCGDLLNDYEGITGYEEFRGDLALMYLPALDISTGCLVDLRLTPMQTRQFRLHRASRAAAEWLRDTINRESREFRFRVELRGEPHCELRPA